MSPCVARAGGAVPVARQSNGVAYQTFSRGPLSLVSPIDHTSGSTGNDHAPRELERTQGTTVQKNACNPNNTVQPMAMSVHRIQDTPRVTMAVHQQRLVLCSVASRTAANPTKRLGTIPERSVRWQDYHWTQPDSFCGFIQLPTQPGCLLFISIRPNDDTGRAARSRGTVRRGGPDFEHAVRQWDGGRELSMWRIPLLRLRWRTHLRRQDLGKPTNKDPKALDQPANRRCCNARTGSLRSRGDRNVAILGSIGIAKRIIKRKQGIVIPSRIHSLPNSA